MSLVIREPSAEIRAPSKRCRVGDGQSQETQTESIQCKTCGCGRSCRSNRANSWDRCDFRFTIILVRIDHRLPVALAHPVDWIKIFDPTDWTVFVETMLNAPPGTPVQIEISVAGWSVSLLGSVVGSRDEGVIGLTVAVASSEREKINYLNGFVRGGLLNHREKRRLPLQLKVTYGAVDGPATTTTKDVSDEGLFLLSDKPLPPTSQLHMLITVPDRKQPWSVMGKVSHAIGIHDELPAGMGIMLDLNDVQRTEWTSILVELEAKMASGEIT